MSSSPSYVRFMLQGLWPRPVADALKATGEYIESVRARMGW